MAVTSLSIDDPTPTSIKDLMDETIRLTNMEGDGGIAHIDL